VHDRVMAGEMPPKEKKRPAGSEMAQFIRELGASLTAAETAASPDGRATRRRLNRAEFENSLRDLLQIPWLQIQEMLPEDGEFQHFAKSSEALDVSFVHLRLYVQAADVALREAMGVQLV